MFAFIAHLPLPSMRRGLLVALMAALGLSLGGCSTSPPPRPPHPRDPTLSVLDRIIARGGLQRDPRRCLAELATAPPCGPDAPPRTLELHVALDPRYRRWPQWTRRLDDTLTCVNTLYAKTGVRWHIAAIFAWDPGADRHRLYPLLARLRRELPGTTKALRLGITVWDPRHIFRIVGGEIGLSQGGACVVPSWPRVENDCLILAHELGHLIGAKHVPGKRWVMGRAARTVFYLPARDPLARVIASYRFHPRNVAVIRAYRAARITPEGLRLLPPCRARIRAIDRCYGL